MCVQRHTFESSWIECSVMKQRKWKDICSVIFQDVKRHVVSVSRKRGHAMLKGFLRRWLSSKELVQQNLSNTGGLSSVSDKEKTLGFKRHHVLERYIWCYCWILEANLGWFTISHVFRLCRQTLSTYQMVWDWSMQIQLLHAASALPTPMVYHGQIAEPKQNGELHVTR